MEQAAAEKVIEPILDVIQRCIEEAWTVWETFYAPQHHVLDARARASIVYCHIVERASVLFRGVPGVTFGLKRGIYRLFVGDDIALRFKKARKDGTTSNITTQQQKLIDLQLRIPGILPGTMLNAVYQLDGLQRAIERMMVTHQLDGKIQWSISIKGEPISPVLMPYTGASPAAPKPRARLKGVTQPKKSRNSK